MERKDARRWRGDRRCGRGVTRPKQELAIRRLLAKKAYRWSKEGYGEFGLEERTTSHMRRVWPVQRETSYAAPTIASTSKFAMAYQHANHTPSSTSPEPIPDGPFEIHATAPTDIWRKPPSIDVFNAPITYRSLPIASFKRARVTAVGEWKTLYDQGGLVLVFPPKKSDTTQNRWVKCGIEFYNDAPRMSVVAADQWADWSLLPLGGADQVAGRMTVEVERKQEKDGSWGSVLKIYLVDGEGGRMPIREVTWVFHDLDEKENMWVGVFAAKPTRDERDELVVTIEKFEIELRK